jgi:hypothetical protein
MERALESCSRDSVRFLTGVGLHARRPIRMLPLREAA